MQTLKQYSNHLLLSMLFMLTVFIAGCGSDGDPILGSSTSTTTATPVVLSTTPIDGDVNVTRNTNITAFFDKELDGNTVNATTFTLKNGVTAVAGAVTYANKAMILNPTSNLDANTTYDATITTGVKDLDGNALATEYVWSFETGDVLDLVAPTVISTDPEDNATGVPTNRSPSALFSETLDPSTVTTTTFTLKKGTTAVDGNVSYASKTMIFNPTVDLDANTTYDANITTGVTDLAGNALAANKTWSFTTGDAPLPALAPVNLGTAGSFTILTKTGITNVPTSAIVGDIGSSPITGASMNTVTCSEVTGNIYGVDETYAVPCYKGTAADKTYVDNAVADMQLAYADAAGRTNPDFTELGAGDVSGQTLVPGLYKWGTGLLIDPTGVTISGGATDVWIFQISGDLTVSNGAIITLAGGALAKNIFWQVAGLTGVSIGTSAQFKGVVLAEKAITVNSGATVDKGRLLAQTAVTLDANIVTKPLD